MKLRNLALLWLLVSHQPLLADIIQLIPSKDNTLYEDAQGDWSNGAGTHLYAGMTGTSGGFDLRRAVLEFDLSAIPLGSVVHSAELQVSIDKKGQSESTDFMHLHEIEAEWGEGESDAGLPGGLGAESTEGDATWIHRLYPDHAWSSPGGDFDNTATASVPFNNVETEDLIFDAAGVTADVQGWVNRPGTNHGWILLGDENTAKNARRLYSRESAGAVPQGVPTLTVNFTPASVTDNLSLTEVASGLTGPVAIANAADGSGRLFIVEQRGIIRIFDTSSQTLVATPYLDIQAAVESAFDPGGGNEQGLLGLAFHPDFVINRQFYVYYTRDPGVPLDRSRVAMYHQSEGNANVADSTETVILEFEQDASNHNGGDMHFGADGLLYVVSGDGGGSNDQYGHAQNSASLKGKMLRIDVDGAPAGGEELCGLVANYAIPPGNAFPANNDGCDEILHFGLRNPWRFSFDAQTEDIYIGDVGQNTWEEVDFVAAGSSGLNFGWSCREGLHAFPAGNACVAGTLTEPVIEYSSASGGNCSVTGGYVYRGGSSALFGLYVYGDYCSDRIWLARAEEGGWSSEEWEAAAGLLNGITAFGQDEQCELYVAEADPGTGAGAIYRIDDSSMIRRSGFERVRCQ